METNSSLNHETPPAAKPLLAADLIQWLETERTILFNHAAFMLDPVEYRNTMDVVNSINQTLEYIKQNFNINNWGRNAPIKTTTP